MHSIEIKMRCLAYVDLCHWKAIHSPHIHGWWMDIKEFRKIVGHWKIHHYRPRAEWTKDEILKKKTVEIM